MRLRRAAWRLFAPASVLYLRLSGRVGRKRHEWPCWMHPPNVPTAAAALKAQVAQIYPDVPSYVSDAGATLAVHVGPGTLGLAVVRAD